MFLKVDFHKIFRIFRKNVEKLHFYTKNDDAEFENEVFLHVGHDLTIKKDILRQNLKIQKIVFSLKKMIAFFLTKRVLAQIIFHWWYRLK
jgi:hypothetical protein